MKKDKTKPKQHPVMRVINALGVVLMLFAMTVLVLACISAYKNNQGGDVRSSGVFGYTPVIIESGSMAPVISEHGIVVMKAVKDVSQLKERDIIIFDAGEDTNVCHRIIDIRPEGIYTMGDAAAIEDGVPLTEKEIFGLVPENRLFIWNWAKRIVERVRPEQGIIQWGEALKYLGFVFAVLVFFAALFYFLERFLNRRMQEKGETVISPQNIPAPQSVEKAKKKWHLTFSKEGNRLSGLIRLFSHLVLCVGILAAVCAAGWMLVKHQSAQGKAVFGYYIMHMDGDNLGSAIYSDSDFLVRSLKITERAIHEAVDGKPQVFVTYRQDEKILTRQLANTLSGNFTVRESIADLMPSSTLIPYTDILGIVQSPMNWTAQIYHDINKPAGIFKWIALPVLLLVLLFVLLRLLMRLHIVSVAETLLAADIPAVPQEYEDVFSTELSQLPPMAKPEQKTPAPLPPIPVMPPAAPTATPAVPILPQEVPLKIAPALPEIDFSDIDAILGMSAQDLPALQSVALQCMASPDAEKEKRDAEKPVLQAPEMDFDEIDFDSFLMEKLSG